MNLYDLFNEEKVRLDPKCWTGKKIGNPKTKMKGGVRVNNCVPAESVAEGTRASNEVGGADSMRQKLGNIIKQAVQNDEGAYNASGLYRKLWDIYGGDIDAIIAERSIFELQKLARELVSVGKQGMSENATPQLNVQQLATISDAALDDAYGYGRSTPGNTFGWQANLKSAAYAKQMIDQGVTDVEAISDAIHKGWNTTAQAFVQDPEQFDDTAKLAAAGKLEAKLQQRAQLMKQNYSQLPEEEKEKDRVVARALLQAIRGEQGVAEGATITRIDSKPITDFGSSLKAYKHTDDWSQSGVDTGDDSYWKNKNLKTNTTKGLFAGDPKRTALYATGNAHETRYVEFTQDGQPIVYFDRKDLPAMRSRKTYLTVFDANDFRQLPTGEWFSENPGKPIKQVPIGDPFKYIASQGWIVRVTDDLDKVFKQVKNMHKAGKIVQYGAEGMNESKQGVAEGQLELNTPDPVVVVQDLKGNILDKINLSVAAQKYKLGQPQNIKNQLAHQNYTKVGNYTIVSPMSGQPQDATTQGVAETELDEKSVSQAQFRTMAGAAHNPEFAQKVGISQDVAKEFNRADKKSNYKKLPDRATEGEQQPGADYRDPKEVDYDDKYDAMVARVKKLAGLGPMKTTYDPAKRQYRNMPTAQQPKK